MNRKGTMALSILTSIFFFFAGMIIMNFVLPEVNLATGVLGLNCSDNSISDGTKVTCLGFDFVVPYLILLIISVTMGRIINSIV